jgi:hypothetical protein
VRLTGVASQGEAVAEEPYLLTHVCKQCGVKVRVSKRSMRLYSHRPPGMDGLCPATEAVVGDDEVTREPIPRKPRSELEKKKRKKRKRRRARRSESVWTVSGGLPGLGRRR